jgi:hypothetical protein
MELITILNRCHRFRGFVYQHAHFSADEKSNEVAARPRKGSAAVGALSSFPYRFGSPSHDYSPSVPLNEMEIEELTGALQIIGRLYALLVSPRNLICVYMR